MAPDRSADPEPGDTAATGSPAVYPAQWEADVLASDGGTLHLRPIRPDDAERLVALHSRLSERTRYLRYFGAYPQIPPRDLRRFTHVDYVDRVALVAELAGEIVGVGRFDRLLPTDDAEVAFVVEDAHQGRGIGSVLLEHLAAAARERGVRRFVAEVLAENSRMVRVFLEAGYSASPVFEQGVVHLSFPIEPTDASVGVAYERERRAEARSVERLLTPRSVAVIGASNDTGKIGHAVFASLLSYGFQGPIYPVNPGVRHVGGVRAYPSVLDVPDEVDLAVLAVPAAAVPQVVEECARKSVRGLVVVSAGFGELGGSGAEAERALVTAARANGMRVVGPNCLGVLNSDPVVRLNATLAPVVPARGRVGFFCQSGGLGVAILETATRRGLGLSTFVSAGNRADVSGNDLLQFWESDPATEVVLLYLESFGNPRKFARLARRLARRKPVVAVKSGRHGMVTPALASGSMPLPDEAVQAIFEASGVIRVETLTGLLDVAQLLAYQPLPAGDRVAAVTNSSALGVLVVDACQQAGLTLAAPGPVDVGPAGSVADFAAALRSAVERADAVVAVFVPPVATSGDDYAQALADVASGVGADRGVPVLSTFLGTEGVPAPLRRLGGDGTVARGSVPSYPTPERAVRALARVSRYAQWRRRPVCTLRELPDVAADTAAAVIAAALAAAPGKRELTRDEGAVLLGAYGIRLWPGIPVGSADEAVTAADRLGYPVALKSLAARLRHRPDLGAVRLDLPDAPAVRAAWQALPPGSPAAAGDGRAAASSLSAGARDGSSRAAGAAEFGAGPGRGLVQPMAAAGVAAVVGLVDDPSFGALVSFGLGGVATELLGDRAYAAVPLSDLDAAALVRAPRAAPLLSGYRDAEPVDTAGLEDLLLRLSRLAEDHPEVLEVELNPVLVSQQGLAVLAAHIRVGPPTARADLGPRRLR
jgi:acyl-CoA synthetase (NDP forming)/GNAT superfamily N-acetyltransferase